MCSIIPTPHLRLVIHWNGLNESLNVYFSIDPEEPFLNRVMKDGSDIDIKISPSKSRCEFRFSTITEFRYYTGSGSDYSKQYPPTLTPHLRQYSMHHCRDVMFIKRANRSGVFEAYDSMFQSMIVDGNPSWNSTRDYGCKWQKEGKQNSLRCTVIQNLIK